MTPGCVKTHTSAKCRKHNSPARHPTSRVQYDLTLRDAIAQRYFYVWRERRSFRTAKTHLRHKRDRNPAAQQPAAVPSCAILSGQKHGRELVSEPAFVHCADWRDGGLAARGARAALGDTKALGITVPLPLSGRADEVIE